MRELEAERRLVKSAPELWSQCSDATALARHLNRFGEIRIARLEDEHTVAWEGDRIRGTVELAASGWGTRVRLTAVADAPAPPPPARPTVPSALGLRLLGLIRDRVGRSRPRPVPAPAAAPSPPVEPERPAADVLAQLEAALDSLGAAHHRPYSR